MSPQVRIGKLQHRDGHVVALRDPRQRLTPRDVMIDEGHALVDRQIRIPLGHLSTRAARHPDSDLPSRRRNAADELGVQLEHRGHRRVGQPGDHVKPGGIGNRDLVEDEGRQALDVGEPVVRRLLRD